MASSLPNASPKNIQLLSLMKECQDLLGRTGIFQQNHVPGARKLQKQIGSELKFLKKLRSNLSSLETNQLLSSNLPHIHGIVECVETSENVTAVLQMFPHGNGSLCVDVVCEYGKTWNKVIARNVQALHMIWVGEGAFGKKSIVDQAQEYIDCAAENLIEFQHPKVKFLFYKGVTDAMAISLEKVGVTVVGKKVDILTDKELKLRKLKEIQEYKFEDETTLVCDGLEGIEIGVADKKSSVLNVHISQFDINRLTSSKLSVHGAESKTERHFVRKDTSDLQSLKLCSDLVGQADVDKIPDRKDMLLDTKDVTSMKKICSEVTCQTDMDKIFDRNNSIACTPEEINDLKMLKFDIDFIKKEKDISKILLEPVSSKVNLDITTMIAMISALTHGGCHFVFKEDILTEQARWERETPVLPQIMEFIKGKTLYACDSALKDFIEIVNIIAGPAEKCRAKALLQNITRVPDSMSEMTQRLKLSGKAKDRAKIIFGFGDVIHAVTVTANSGFTRAAQGQGIKFAVYLHGSRALTEKKEETAMPLRTSSSVNRESDENT